MKTIVKTRLKDIRQQKKLTHQDVADHLNVDRTTYTQYEMGKRNPSTEVISTLAEFYGCSADYLLGLTDDPSPPPTESDLSPDEQELLEAYNKAKASDKAHIKALAKAIDKLLGIDE